MHFDPKSQSNDLSGMHNSLLFPYDLRKNQLDKKSMMRRKKKTKRYLKGMKSKRSAQCLSSKSENTFQLRKPCRKWTLVCPKKSQKHRQNTTRDHLYIHKFPASKESTRLLLFSCY